MPWFAYVALPLVAFMWVAWLICNWIGEAHQRRLNAERFDRWMRQERSVTSTLDEIRNLPEVEAER